MRDMQMKGRAKNIPRKKPKHLNAEEKLLVLNDQRSKSEIAAAYDISVGTVRSIRERMQA